jgi:hypothetical protein
MNLIKLNKIKNLGKHSANISDIGIIGYNVSQFGIPANLISVISSPRHNGFVSLGLADKIRIVQRSLIKVPSPRRN